MEFVKSPYEEKVFKIVNDLKELFGYDFEKEQADWEEKGSRRIYADEGAKKTLFESENLIKNGKYDIGLINLYNELPEFAQFITLKNRKHFEDDEHLNQELRLINIIKELTVVYSDWKDEEYTPYIDEFKKKEFFKEEDFEGEEMNPNFLPFVNRAVVNNAFKTYNFRDGGDKITLQDEYYIYPTIGYSDDLNYWFNNLEKQTEYVKSQDEGKVFVTLFGKLDRIDPHYSSFIISIHKGSTIWISSDQIDFDNPHQKRSRSARGKSDRSKEFHYENIALPYEVFLNIEELRNAQTGLSSKDSFEVIKIDVSSCDIGWGQERDEEEKLFDLIKVELNKRKVEYGRVYGSEYSNSFHSISGVEIKHKGSLVGFGKIEDKELILTIYNRPEFLFSQVEDMDALDKIYFVSLCARLIESIRDFRPTENVLLSSEYLEQKLLEGADFDPAEQEGYFSHWGDDVKKRAEEIIEGVESENTALVKRDYGLVLSSSEYDSSWLATPKALERLNRWIVVEDEKNKIDEKLKKIEERKEGDWKILRNSLNRKYDSIAEKLYRATIITASLDMFGVFGSEGDEREIEMVNPLKMEKKSVYDKRGFGIGKTQYEEESCFCCNDKNTINQIKVDIKHYGQLMWLLDVKDKKELPIYFRNYKHHSLIPYTGNSSLDHTNPYSRLEDPCSDRNPNGISMLFYACGRCSKKYKKEYFVADQIKIDLSNNKILEQGEIKNNAKNLRMII